MEYFLHIMVIVGIYAILAMSLDIIVGYAGIPALGHAAFSLIGAYCSSLLSLNGLSPWIGMFCGALLASVLGIVVAYPTIKLKGDYLALATLGLGIIAHGIAKNYVNLTRGPMGLPGIPHFKIFSYPLAEEWKLFNFSVDNCNVFVCVFCLFL